VGETAWYYDAVYYCADTGIFQGNDDGSFAPEKTMTLAELVTILYRTAGYQTDNSGEHWYSKQLDWAVENGIIAAADFSENAQVTREDFIVMLYNAIKLGGKYDTAVTDAMLTALQSAADYSVLDDSAYNELAWAVSVGLIKGTDEEVLTVSPESSIKRDEVCTMLMRYYAGAVAAVK
jgi:S-layer homology domain.